MSGWGEACLGLDKLAREKGHRDRDVRGNGKTLSFLQNFSRSCSVAGVLSDAFCRDGAKSEGSSQVNKQGGG